MARMPGLLIPEAVIERLRNRVKMDGERELRAFVSDAIDTYVALGGLVAQGAELQMKAAGNGRVRRLRLPFQLRSASARPDPAEPCDSAASVVTGEAAARSVRSGRA